MNKIDEIRKLIQYTEDKINTLMHDVEYHQTQLDQLKTELTKINKIRVGQVYSRTWYGNISLYLLTQVDDVSVSLINLYNMSNRYVNPIKVNNISDITPDEFKAICYNNTFEYVCMIEDLIDQSKIG